MTVTVVSLQENLTEHAAHMLADPYGAAYAEYQRLREAGMPIPPRLRNFVEHAPPELLDPDQYARDARRTVNAATHLVSMPVVAHYKIANYIAGRARNILRFAGLPQINVKLGVFDVTADGFRRAVIVAVPDAGGAPTSVLYGLMPHLCQDTKYYVARSARLPVAEPTIVDCLGMLGILGRAGVVHANYIAQEIANIRRTYALVVPVRSLGAPGSSANDELGPFAADGRVVNEVLDELARTCGGAFAPGAIDAFGHSSGCVDLARLSDAMRRGPRPIRHAVAIDPSPSIPPTGCTGHLAFYASDYVRNARRMSGHRAEFIDFPRWRDEPNRLAAGRISNEGAYLHNGAYPAYLLNVGLDATPP
jgi:hypothetical protein